MLIYTEKISNRLKYACNAFFKYLCKTNYELTSNKDQFIEFSGAKINYSAITNLPGVQVVPNGLLFDKGVKEQNIIISEWEGVPVFYQTNQDLLIPFDVFSASFYLLSRYEEYLPFIGDNHSRFMADSSLAHQYGFLHIPVVDHWTVKFIEKIRQIYPSCQFDKREFEFIATVDVDSAYAYKNKGFVRLIGGFAKDLKSFDFANFKYRFVTVFGKSEDPFDTYELLDDLHKEYGVKAIFFFLVANYGMNDKNLPHSSRKFQELIRSVADYNTIGIHPGYQSNKSIKTVEEEIKRLSDISKRPIINSRQHFLMLRFPETYANLVELDITDDYTMGYADYPGFRAGTCSSFPFYNLQSETITNLILHPFTVMDATLNKYRNESPDEAIQSIKVLMDEVKKVNGTFISLWHNESLSEKWHWKGWRRVYKEMLKSI